MKPESIVVGIAGALFGLLCGWMLGAQQVGPAQVPAAQVAQAGAGGAAPAAAGQPGSTAQPLDIARSQALEKEAAEKPGDAEVRTQLGNLYFDAERYADAAKWYEASLQIAPANPDVSTDLAVSYYYANQVDQALAQFARSLEINPETHQDLAEPRDRPRVRQAGPGRGRRGLESGGRAGARPTRPEARAAKQALDGLKSAHPEVAPGSAPAAGAATPAPAAPKQGA